MEIDEKMVCYIIILNNYQRKKKRFKTREFTKFVSILRVGKYRRMSINKEIYDELERNRNRLFLPIRRT